MKNQFALPIHWTWWAVLALVTLGLVGCKLVQTLSLVQPAPTESAPRELSTLVAPATIAPAHPAATPLVPPSAPAATALAGAEVIEPGQLPEDSDPSLALLPDAQPDIALLPDAPRYRIGLQINADGTSFSGSQAVQVTNQEDQTLESLYFRLLPNGGKSYGNGFLAVSQVLLDGQSLETTLSLDDSVLEVLLPQPLPPGETLTLTFDFEGQVTRDFGGSRSPSGYGIYSLVDEVLSLSSWYPILSVYDGDGWNLDPVSDIGDSVYSEMAFYTVRICAPSNWFVAATGVAAAEDKATGCTQYEGGPVRDFFLAASPRFQTAEVNVAGTTIRSVYPPEHAAAGNKTLQVAADSMKIFNQRFGLYPYKELDIVEVPLRYASGVEFPGIILLAENQSNDPNSPDFPMTTAHEVAHQWWYSLVGNDIFDEPWLDEGLATYSSTLYFEEISGRASAQEYLSFWRRYWESLVNSGDDEIVTQPLSHFEGLRDAGQVYSGVVYLKSAVFYDALRQEIGDEAFFAALRAYYQTFRYRVATTDDLLNAFEEAAGRSLDDFYQKWLYSKGLPE